MIYPESVDDTADARVGTRFAGRYDLSAVLGEGGMGAVYRARHAFTGAEVALKILHAGLARSKNARERFLREAQAPSAISHPGIAKVSDALEPAFDELLNALPDQPAIHIDETGHKDNGERFWTWCFKESV